MDGRIVGGWCGWCRKTETHLCVDAHIKDVTHKIKTPESIQRIVWIRSSKPRRRRSVRQHTSEVLQPTKHVFAEIYIYREHRHYICYSHVQYEKAFDWSSERTRCVAASCLQYFAQLQILPLGLVICVCECVWHYQSGSLSSNVAVVDHRPMCWCVFDCSSINVRMWRSQIGGKQTKSSSGKQVKCVVAKQKKTLV